MRQRTRGLLRIIAGTAFWSAILFFGFRSLGATELGQSITSRLRAHATAQPRRVSVSFPASARLQAGSPVRMEREGSRELVQIGTVVSMQGSSDQPRAEVLFFPDFDAHAARGGTLLAHETRGDIAWILRTILPPELRDRLQKTVRRRWEREHPKLLRELEPGLTRLVDDLTAALRKDLERVVSERDEDFRRLGEVLIEQGWEGPVEEAVRDRVWPRLRDRATPLIGEIGDEMIAAFPVGSTAWDLVVDKLPFSEERRVRERLRSFADEHAIPILQRREGDFRQIALDVIRESARDPKIRGAMGAAAGRVASDPRFRASILAVLRSWIIENQEVAAIARGLWDREDLRLPVLNFLKRFEPDVHRLANEIVLDDSGRGIDPELARVLRRKILRDDERWLLFQPAANPSTSVRFEGRDGGVR